MARHFDKVLLAVALAIFGDTLLRATFLHRDAERLAFADAVIRESSRPTDAYRREAAALRALNAGYSAEALWTAPRAVAPLKPWVDDLPPAAPPPPPPPPGPEKRLGYPAVEIHSIAADVAAVRLTLKVTPVEESPILTPAEVRSLVLQRRAAGGDWVDVATLDVAAIAFDDKSASPKTRYEYRAAAQDGPWSDAAAVTTPPHVTWQWRGTVNGRATFLVNVYVPALGQGFDVRVDNAPGERIGSRLEDATETRTTLHRLPGGLVVDLDTGADLKSTAPGSVTVVEDGVDRVVKRR